MGKPFAFGAAFGMAIALAFAQGARAQAVDMRWEMLASDEKAIIDRLAADFYEESLRKSQSYAIEAKTSERYAGAAPVERARFRETRRGTWEEMSEAQRQALKNAKRPSFANLAEEQKAPFRTIALDKLDAAGAIDEDALMEAVGQDI